MYSTESGRVCPSCGKAIAQCICRKKPVAPVGSGDVRVMRESKGRHGKDVTVIRGVALDAVALALLGKQLRAACGTGGTVKDGAIELLGDHCDKVIELLKKQEIPARRVGSAGG